jgi:hypothetical protein
VKEFSQCKDDTVEDKAVIQLQLMITSFPQLVNTEKINRVVINKDVNKYVRYKE